MDIESFVIRKAIGFIEALEGTDSSIADEVGPSLDGQILASERALDEATIQDEITVINDRLDKVRDFHFVEGKMMTINSNSWRWIWTSTTPLHWKPS